MSIEGEANGVEQGARKLQGAMLEHSNLAVERMPGLGYALNRFIAEAPLRLSSLIARPSAGSIEEVRATTLFQAIEDCAGLTRLCIRASNRSRGCSSHSTSASTT